MSSATSPARRKKEITSCDGVDSCALLGGLARAVPAPAAPTSLAYPSMTRSRNARVGRLYGLGRRRAARSPHAPVGEDLHEQPFPSGGLLRGLLPRLTSVRLRGTVVTSSAMSSGWSCVPAPRRRSRRLSSGVRNVRPNAQSSGIESCQKASTILGAFHASTRRAFGSAVSSRRKLEWKR